MSKEVVIIDYGMGNLHSVTKAIAAVGGKPIITADKEVIAKAEKVILPGVGAFGDCMANLHKSGLVPLIMELLESGIWNFKGVTKIYKVEGFDKVSEYIKKGINDYKNNIFGKFKK